VLGHLGVDLPLQATLMHFICAETHSPNRQHLDTGQCPHSGGQLEEYNQAYVDQETVSWRSMLRHMSTLHVGVAEGGTQRNTGLTSKQHATIEHRGT